MKRSLGAKTIVYPTPVFIVGSYDENGQPNAMAVAWGGICCSKPPCVTISLRKATYTYGNIVKSRAYTINIPPEEYLEQADYFGMASGRNENKFEVTGLTPVKSDLVNAPYIKEFPFVLECRVIHVFEIGLHTQFIGEILDIKAEDSVLNDDNIPLLERIKPFSYDPATRAYFGIDGKLNKAYSAGKRFK